MSVLLFVWVDIIDPHRSLMEKHIDMQNVARGIGRYATMVKTCVCFYVHLCKEAEQNAVQ